MNEAQLFAFGITLAWLAGIRAYLTVFGLGVAGLTGWLELPTALQACASPWVLATSGVLALVEFGADKIPGVDSGWDLLQTLLRIPAGAFLASAALAGPDGELGMFQHHFLVYDREDMPCKLGCRGTVKRIVQAGRSTFYCPKCQK